MQVWLTGLLAAAGITGRLYPILARMMAYIEKLPIVPRTLIKYVVKTVATALAAAATGAIDEVEEFLRGLYEGIVEEVLKFITRKSGTELYGVTKYDFDEWSGRLMAAKFTKYTKIPVDTFYPFEQMPDQLGVIFAQEANKKIGDDVFTSLYPADNVVNEFEAYIILRVQEDAHITISTVRNADVMVDEIKDGVIFLVQDKVQDALNEALSLASSELDNVIAAIEANGEPLPYSVRLQIRGAIIDKMDKLIETSGRSFEQFIPKFAFNLSPKRRRAKRLGRKRQARYRLTHIQDTTWRHR